MLKRWAAGLRGIRWAVGIFATVIVVAAIAWVLFVPTADWLATHDVGQVTGPLRTLRLQTAKDAARGRLLTLGAGLFALAALVYTGRNFTLSREGQVTDRYTKAIEQLSSDKLEARIGGIYALERVTHDSPKDHPTVMSVLAAFIREHSRRQAPPSASETPSGEAPERAVRPDVQAALTVICRRNQRLDREQINLAYTHLRGADLANARLALADLRGADLADARLFRADLADAHLRGAILQGADLTDANLIGAILPGADLTDANLHGADLFDVDFSDAELVDARLTGAKLAGAFFGGANLTGALLIDPDLTGAAFVEDVPVPEGWLREASSGRLKRQQEVDGAGN